MAKEYTYEETSKFIDTDIGKLHYHEAGEGPVLLLIHGSGPGVSGWANFKGNLGLFSEHFRTLILDLPGYGESPSDGGNVIFMAMPAVTSFLEALGIDEKIRIVGNSLGGIVGAMFANMNADKVDRLVTIGGIGGNLFNAGPAEGINLLVDFTEDPTRDRLVTWLRSMVYDKGLITEELIEERFKRATDPKFMQANAEMYNRQATDMREMAVEKGMMPRGWDMVKDIKCPLLITWGRDDRVSPLDMALVPMRVVKHAELHVFPNCGHWAMIEAKDAFEATVLGFLTRETPEVDDE